MDVRSGDTSLFAPTMKCMSFVPLIVHVNGTFGIEAVIEGRHRRNLHKWIGIQLMSRAWEYHSTAQVSDEITH
jgi:hypothetical protein